MGNTAGQQLTIDDVLEFNEQLMFMESIKIPLELGFQMDRSLLDNKLLEIKSRLAIRHLQGKTIEEVLLEDQEIPSQYRASLVAWARGGRSIRSISSLVMLGRWRRNAVKQLNTALIQPLTLLALVYLGFLCLFWILIPNLEGIYMQIRKQPGICLSILSRIRSWEYVWGPAFPIIALAIVLAWRAWIPKSNLRMLPQKLLETTAVRNSNLAESLAGLIDAGHTPEQAVSWVNRDKIDVDRSKQSAMPPLIQWALVENREADEQAIGLRFFGEIYRNPLRYSMSRSGRNYSSILGAILAGMLVLGFGLSLFLPMIELLYTLVLP
jgi:type II secretory pathway component PulF